MLYIVNCCNNNMDMLANTMRKSKGWTNMNTFTLSTSCSSSTTTTTTPKRDKGKYMWKIYKEYTFVIHTHTHILLLAQSRYIKKVCRYDFYIYITLAQFAVCVCVWDALLAWSNIILALLMQEVYDKYTNAQYARKLLQTKSLRIRESARRLLQLCHRSTALVRH